MPAAAEHRPSQSAQSIGPWARVASRSWLQVGGLQRLEAAGRVGVDPEVVGVVHRHARGADPLVGPDRVQQSLERRELPLGQHRDLLHHLVEDVPLALAAEEVAGDLLHGDQADALLPAGVERLVQGRILVEPGAVLEHDRVDDAPFGGRLEDLGTVLVVARDADQPGLARLADGVGGLLELAALDEVQGLVERVVVAEAVDEEEIDVVGAHVGQPLVELAHDFRGRPRQVLGDDEDLLADLGLLLEPELEVGLGLVLLRGVEAADPLGVGVPEDPLDAPPPGRFPRRGW